MKKERVTRMKCTCDHCGKTSYSVGHMNKHEQRCTMNPNRSCGMCRLAEEDQLPVEELMAALPTALVTEDDYGNRTEVLEPSTADAALKRLRAITHCPACIMAAIRQKGHLAPLFENFRYRIEMDAWLRDCREEER